MKKYYYEVLWYTDEELRNYESIGFQTKKQALNFYEKHKNDEDKFAWWVTKRYMDDDSVAEDIIY